MIHPFAQGLCNSLVICMLNNNTKYEILLFGEGWLKIMLRDSLEKLKVCRLVYFGVFSYICFSCWCSCKLTVLSDNFWNLSMWLEFASPDNQHPKSASRKKAHKPLHTSWISQKMCLSCLIIMQSCYFNYRINKPFTYSRCLICVLCSVQSDLGVLRALKIIGSFNLNYLQVSQKSRLHWFQCELVPKGKTDLSPCRLLLSKVIYILVATCKYMYHQSA